MILADKIIQQRKKNGWSQEDLAEKVDVSRQAISRWENGTAFPDAQNLLRLSKLFLVTADYLLDDDAETRAEPPTAEEKPEAKAAAEAPPPPPKRRRLLWLLLPFLREYRSGHVRMPCRIYGSPPGIAIARLRSASYLQTYRGQWQ